MTKVQTTDETEEVTAADVNAMTKADLVSLIDDNELDVDHKKIKELPALKKAVLEVLDLEVDDHYVADAPAKGNAKGVAYTYIGGGADSPRVINLMGKQKFVRGELTTVTDKELLDKLPGLTTFVKGKADQETLHRIDEEGKAAEDEQKAHDLITNAKYTKKHRTE